MKKKKLSKVKQKTSPSSLFELIFKTVAFSVEIFRNDLQSHGRPPFSIANNSDFLLRMSSQPRRLASASFGFQALSSLSLVVVVGNFFGRESATPPACYKLVASWKCLNLGGQQTGSCLSITTFYTNQNLFNHQHFCSSTANVLLSSIRWALLTEQAERVTMNQH